MSHFRSMHNLTLILFSTMNKSEKQYYLLACLTGTWAAGWDCSLPSLARSCICCRKAFCKDQWQQCYFTLIYTVSFIHFTCIGLSNWHVFFCSICYKRGCFFCLYSCTTTHLGNEWYMAYIPFCDITSHGSALGLMLYVIQSVEWIFNWKTSIIPS